MHEPIKITVTDPETGEILAERILDNDYLILCAGNRYLAGTVVHQNGTATLTVKVDQ